ncbi:MAG: hypothetical protein F6J86_06315 [Symploca sp. SIO1B1]|nr:hypothetical protein [Symploca sp. SIO1B1]
MAGKLLSQHYQIVEVLGVGGFSQTYLAEDIYRGNRTCVVKHFQPASSDSSFLQAAQRLFQREAEILEKLGHHNQIPQLLAYFEDENQDFYLVLDYTAGQPLSTEMLSGYCWSENQVIELLQELLELLVFIHSYGVIHRDIKPDNLIRRELDNRLVLIDFGSIKQIGTQGITPQAHRYVTIPIGTQGYMAAEQGQGNPRPSSDLYSLGIIAIQALIGSEPTQFERDEMGEICWQQQAKVSPELASIINKLVSYHFKDRYQSATEALDALQPLIKAQALNQLKFSLNQLGNPSQKPPIASSLQPLVSSSKLRPKFGFPKWPELPIGSGNLKWILPGLGIGMAVATGLVIAIQNIDWEPAEQNNPSITSDKNKGDIQGETEQSNSQKSGSEENKSDTKPNSTGDQGKNNDSELKKIIASYEQKLRQSEEAFRKNINQQKIFINQAHQQQQKFRQQLELKDKNFASIEKRLTASYEQKLQKYEEALKQAIEQNNISFEQVHKRLQTLRQQPELRPKNVAAIEEQAKSTYQQQLQQSQKEFTKALHNYKLSIKQANQKLEKFHQDLESSTQKVTFNKKEEIVANQQKLQQYEEAFKVAVYEQGLSESQAHQQLQPLRQQLELREEIVKPIEGQVIAAYEEHLQQYGEAFRAFAYQPHVSQGEAHQQLENFRQKLGLSEESVKSIEEQIIFVYQQDLRQYEEDVRIALYIDGLSPEEVHQHLQPSRQKLGLRENTVQPIEEQIIVAFQQDLQQYEEDVRIALYIDGLSPEEVHQHLQPSRQDSGLSEAIVQPIEEQVIVAFQQDLQQYRDAFEFVLAQQAPFSEDYYQAVQELQQEFGLSDRSVAPIEEQVTIAYKLYQEAVAQILEADGSLIDYQSQLEDIQQESGLKDETVGLIEEGVIATYQELENGITKVATQITLPSDAVEAPIYPPAETEEDMESFPEGSETIDSHPLAEIEQDMDSVPEGSEIIGSHPLTEIEQDMDSVPEVSETIDYHPLADTEQDIDDFSEPSEIIGSNPILATEDDVESSSEANEVIDSLPLTETEQDIDDFSEPSEIIGSNSIFTTEDDVESSSEANEAIDSLPLTETEQDIDDFSEPSEIIGAIPLAENNQNSQIEDTFTCPSDNNRSAVISPDGRFLVGISEENKIKVWNCLTGDLLHALRSNSSKVKSVDISSDSQKVLSISADNTREIWSLHTGELLITNVGDVDSDSESNQIF